MVKSARPFDVYEGPGAVYMVNYENLKDKFTMAFKTRILREEKKSEVTLSISNGKNMTDDQMSEFIEEIFDIWFEQKIVREVCKQQLGKEVVAKHDLNAVNLNSDMQYGQKHGMLNEGMAVDVMGLDPCNVDVDECELDTKIGFTEYNTDRK